MKALIFGLENTPYAHGGYIFDVFIPDEYPLVLPRVSIVYPNDNFTFFKSNLCTDELFNMKFLS